MVSGDEEVNQGEENESWEDDDEEKFPRRLALGHAIFFVKAQHLRIVGEREGAQRSGPVGIVS